MGMNTQNYPMLFNLEGLLTEKINDISKTINNYYKAINMLESFKKKMDYIRNPDLDCNFSKEILNRFLNLNGIATNNKIEEFELPNLNIADFSNPEVQSKYASVLGAFYYFGEYMNEKARDTAIANLRELILPYTNEIYNQIRKYNAVIEEAEKTCEYIKSTINYYKEVLDVYNKEDHQIPDRKTISVLIHHIANIKVLSTEQKLEIIRELELFNLETLERDEQIGLGSEKPIISDFKPKSKEIFEEEKDEDLELVKKYYEEYKKLDYWIKTNKDALEKIDDQIGLFENLSDKLDEDGLTVGGLIDTLLNSYGDNKPFTKEEYVNYAYLRNLALEYERYINDSNPKSYEKTFNNALDWALIYRKYTKSIKKEASTKSVNDIIYLTKSPEISLEKDNIFLGFEFIDDDNHDMLETDYTSLNKGMNVLKRSSVEDASDGIVKGAECQELGLHPSNFVKHRENDIRIIFLDFALLIDKDLLDKYLQDMRPCYIVGIFGKKTTSGVNIYSRLVVRNKKYGSAYVQKFLKIFHDYINNEIRKIEASAETEEEAKKLIVAFINSYIETNNECYEIALEANRNKHGRAINKEETDAVTNENDDGLGNNGGGRK